MLRANLVVVGVLALSLSCPLGSLHVCKAQAVSLPLPKTRHLVGVIGGLITEIPGLAAYDSDFANPYEDIEDPDYVRLYEGLFTTSHYDSNNYADAELLSPSLLMEPKRAAANNVV